MENSGYIWQTHLMDLKKTYHLSCGWETLIVAPPGSLQTTFTALCLQFTFTALHLGLAFRAAGLDFKIATSFTGWWLDLPLWKILVKWEYYSQIIIWKKTCSKTTNQFRLYMCFWGLPFTTWVWPTLRYIMAYLDAKQYQPSHSRRLIGGFNPISKIREFCQWAPSS